MENKHVHKVVSIINCNILGRNNNSLCPFFKYKCVIEGNYYISRKIVIGKLSVSNYY